MIMAVIVIIMVMVTIVRMIAGVILLMSLFMTPALVPQQ
jgi:hypothetical protein